MEWISVKDRLPEEDVDVLFSDGIYQWIVYIDSDISGPCNRFRYQIKDRLMCCNDKHHRSLEMFYEKCIYWMHLPKLPKPLANHNLEA